LEALGRHVLLELGECNEGKLNDLEFVKSTMLNAAVETGATVIGEIFHQFSPQGVTGVVAIAESHVCIHTWPEFRYAAVDIFTCGDGFEPNDAAQLIIERLESRRPEVREVARGILNLTAPVSGT
jgi:S-adenosylmethionine decarboxylase